MITRYFYTYGTSCVIGRILSGHEPKLNMLQNVLLSVITACPLYKGKACARVQTFLSLLGSLALWMGDQDSISYNLSFRKRFENDFKDSGFRN